MRASNQRPTSIPEWVKRVFIAGPEGNLLIGRHNATGQEVWKDNLFSFYEMTAGYVFMGSDRITQSCEGAVRNCMGQLEDTLAEVLKTQSV